MSTEILVAIRQLAAKELDVTGELGPESRLIEDLGLDSLRLLTLAVAVEDTFGICLDEEDEASLETVGDLMTVIEHKKNGDA